MRTNSVIGAPFIKEGRRGVKPCAGDLFDKIINLRFIHKSTRSFSIRSDYETVHHKDGTTSFKKCVQKPDIKITYKQVSESTAIEVDIRITNFFIGDEDRLDDKSINTGIMSVDDAELFGVQCHVSRTLLTMKANVYYRRGINGDEAEVLYPIPSTPFNSMQNTIGGQLVSLQQHYSFLRWYPLMDGSFFFYHKDDKDEDIWNDPFAKRLRKENVVCLPAIYDMTPSGTRTIRCPFVSFISPMMTVLFKSRFTIGTLVGFFYPPCTNAFQVITSTVKFATVQDDNEMELMCVDLPRREIGFRADGELVVKDADAPEGEVPLNAQTGDFDNRQWLERTLNVALRRAGPLDTTPWWDDIVRVHVLSNTRLDRWPEGATVSERTALKALKDWNPEYFDSLTAS